MEGYGLGNFISNDFLNIFNQFVKTRLSYSLLKKNNCSKLIKIKSKELAMEQGRIYNFDCVRQALSLNSIYEFVDKSESICIIGDGYGYMGSMIRKIFPDKKIIFVNLNNILFFDVYYFRKVFPKLELVLMEESDEFYCSMNLFLRAEDYEFLYGLPIDLFINISSFQEINPEITKRYFELMKSSSKEKVYLYSCNREEKVLPDGTITRFTDIPWENTEVLFDEFPNWYQRYPISKPPFWRKFDGKMIHRLGKII